MENEDIYSNIIFNLINQKNDNNQIDELNNNFELLGIDDNNHFNRNQIW